LRRYNTRLANEERKARKSGTATGHTIFQSFSLNQSLLKDFHRTRDAFTRLDMAVRTEASYKKLTPVARDIHRFTSTRFKIRVMGALVTAFRRSRHALPRDSTASLSIRYHRKAGKFQDVYLVSHNNRGTIERPG